MAPRLAAWLHGLRLHSEAASQRKGTALWLTGRERHGGATLSVFYYGTGDSYDYLLKHLYSDHDVVEAREDVGVRAGMQLLRKAATELVVGELSWPYFRAFTDARFLRVPPVVTHRLALPAAWAEIEARYRARKTTRDELNKLEQFELTYRVTRQRAAIERFYDAMYVPYVSQRHGPEAEIDPRADILEAAERGGLLEVVRASRVIAGGILRRRGREMRFLWLGIEPGLEPKLVSAASAALYCYAIRHAIAEGCSELNLMYCMFGLNNGVHRYKRKLGARVCNDWRLGQLVFRVAELSPGVAEFLSNMPLAAGEAGGTLTGRITLTADRLSVNDICNAARYHACEGIARLRLFSTRPVSEEVMSADYTALDERLPPLEVHDLARSRHPAEALHTA